MKTCLIKELRDKAIMMAITLILISCADTSTSVSPPDSGNIYGSGWSAAHGDGANTDFSQISVPQKVRLSWFRKFDGTINLGASSGDDGTIYITTSAPDCHLYALDKTTGETKWCNADLNEFAVASGVLIDRDQRLFIADDKKMYALDKQGKVIWNIEINGFPFSAQFTQTGRLIFITHVGTIYVLDRKTGRSLLRPITISGTRNSLPDFDPRACMRGTKDCPSANTLAFDPVTGQLYFTYWFPDAAVASLVAMRYTEDPDPSLQMVWQNDRLPGGSASSPDISADGSTVYVNDNVGSIHAIDTHTGALRWSYAIGYVPGGSQSTSPDGYLMPGGGDGAKLMCLRDDGDKVSLVWRSDTLENRGIATQALGNIAIATIKVGTLAYELTIVDVRNGRIYDRNPMPGKPLFSVGTTIGSDGLVLVPTFNGYLYAYGQEN
jgi:outer membrane protein assembly factor BamB